MEKKDKNTTRSGDVDHHENDGGSYHDQYSELLEVPIEYLKAVEWKVVIELEDVFESNELDREKLKAVETLKARLFNLHNVNILEDVYLFGSIVQLEMITQKGWLTMMKRQNREAAQKNCQQYVGSSIQSTIKLFEEEDIDISVLVGWASTQLEKIKAYNSKRLGLLEAENLNGVTLQELGNHYSSIYKGIRSLNMKIDILRFHLTQRRRGLKTNLVDRFLASVEGELRQYEEELETTRSKLFELARKKTDVNRTFMSALLKTSILGQRLVLWIKRYNKPHNIRNNEKEKTL